MGLKPAATYGVKVVGMQSSRLLTLRRQLARANGKARTASLTPYLAFKKLEPTQECMAGPVRMWAEACWEEPGKWPAMQQAWSSSRAWLRRGPTGAVARVCRRLGWQWQAFDRL
eukprot:8852566-Lingulodinium_polyedra.AAC.1